MPAAEAAFPINDLGLLRGYGVFDFMRTYNGKVIFIQDHIERLARSAREIGLALPWPKAEIIRLVGPGLVQDFGRDHQVPLFYPLATSSFGSHQVVRLPRT